LAALASGQSTEQDAPGVHNILERIAFRAVPWLEESEHEDLVSEFVVRMLQKTPEARTRDIEKLLALEPKRLVGPLAHRFRQLGAEHARRWGLRKSLREHVRAVWDEQSPPSIGMPSSLLQGEKLSKRHVRAAVNHVRQQSDTDHLDEIGVAEHLLEQ